MKQDAGVVLVNVLVTLALGAAIVVLMFTSQEDLMDRTRRAAAGTQAEALVLGAEASVVAALRRDMQTAPETDHFLEPWALATQEEVVLETGRFSVTVTDVQSRFDLNSLVAGKLAQQQMVLRLTKALEMPDRVAIDIIEHMIRRGAARDLDDITSLDDQTRVTLAPHVSFLPQGGAVNVNTASALVIGAVLGTDSGARQLVKTRDRNGFLTRGDLTDAGVIAMNGIGFTSDVYDVRSVAEVDGTNVTLTSRIVRKTQLGQKNAYVVARRFGADDQDIIVVPPPSVLP